MSLDLWVAPLVFFLCVCVSVHVWVMRRWCYEWAEKGVLSKTPSQPWNEECHLLRCTSAVLREEEEEEKTGGKCLDFTPGSFFFLIYYYCCACCVCRCLSPCHPSILLIKMSRLNNGNYFQSCRQKLGMNGPLLRLFERPAEEFIWAIHQIQACMFRSAWRAESVRSKWKTVIRWWTRGSAASRSGSSCAS